jgi:hypothetical protein
MQLKNNKAVIDLDAQSGIRENPQIAQKSLQRK